MKYIFWIIIIFFLLAVQAGVLGALNLLPANLPLIILALMILFATFEEGLALSVISGVLADWISPLPDGWMLLGTVGAFLTTWVLFHFLLTREPNLWIIIGVVATITLAFGFWLPVVNAVLGWFGQGAQIGIAGFIRRFALPSLLLNIVLTYPVFWFYFWLQKFKLFSHAKSI